MELRLNFKEEKGSQKGKADILKAMSFLVLLGTSLLILTHMFPVSHGKGGCMGQKKPRIVT